MKPNHHLGLLLSVLLFSNIGYTQFPLKGLLRKVSTKMETSLFKQPEPITSSFNDVDTTGSLEPAFGNNENFLSFDVLDFGPNGYILHPGFFQATLQTFCIRAGTPSPIKGDGYMNAKLKGPMADVVNHILWNYLFHETVKQHDVQLLLWAIIAKTPYTDYTKEMKQTVDTLLMPNDINKLKKFGIMSVVTDEMLNNEIVKMPKALQSILKAENEIRKLAQSGSNDYDAYERWAIAGGVVSSGNYTMAKGRWTHVKEGDYYVRYFPHGYKKTLIQLYKPANIPDLKVVSISEHGPFFIDSLNSNLPDCFDPSGNQISPNGDDEQRLVCTPCNDNSEDIKTPFEKLVRGWWRDFKGFIGARKYEVTVTNAGGGPRG